jgi:hypothetical protein
MGSCCCCLAHSSFIEIGFSYAGLYRGVACNKENNIYFFWLITSRGSTNYPTQIGAFTIHSHDLECVILQRRQLLNLKWSEKPAIHPTIAPSYIICGTASVIHTLFCQLFWAGFLAGSNEFFYWSRPFLRLFSKWMNCLRDTCISVCASLRSIACVLLRKEHNFRFKKSKR